MGGLGPVEARLGHDADPVPLGGGVDFKGIVDLTAGVVKKPDGTVWKTFTDVDDLSRDNEFAMDPVIVASLENLELARAGFPEFDHEIYLAGHLTPVIFGSALKSVSVPEMLAALGDLDLGLPPRIEDADSAAQLAAATPSEASESQHEHEFSDLAPAHEAHAELPAHVEPGEDMGPESKPTPAEPEARPSVAGLGAAPIGPLRLSFDLDLPGGEAGDRDGSIAASAPLPEFTPEQLAKIARNKLELAAEYIALGDLGGARTLINEVIESNDVATRDEAHALLATLAPLS